MTISKAVISIIEMLLSTLIFAFDYPNRNCQYLLQHPATSCKQKSHEWL